MTNHILLAGGKTKKESNLKEITIDLGDLLNPKLEKYLKNLDETGIRDAVTSICEISYIPTKKSIGFGLHKKK